MKSGATLVDASKLLKELVVVGLIVAVRTRIASRIDPWRTIKCVDGQTGIVRNSGESGCRSGMTRFE